MTPMVDRVGKGRRYYDGADWKDYAPRWLLVIGVLGFGSLSLINIRHHVQSTDNTAWKVTKVEERTAKLESSFDAVEEELAETRVDMLTFQLYQAKRNKADSLFINYINERLLEAHERAARARLKK